MDTIPETLLLFPDEDTYNCIIKRFVGVQIFLNGNLCRTKLNYFKALSMPGVAYLLS